MTFSIIARCPSTGMLGAAITSSSIAVAARCPWVKAGVGVVATQNVTLPSLGPEILDLIERGHVAEEAMTAALQRNGFNQYRQVAVVDAAGRAAVFTGDQALGTHHAVVGNGCVAAGNLLSSRHVVEAVVASFESQPPEVHLAERLLAALEAGLAAGGEAGPVHSAGLLVADDLRWPLVDLRVDWDETDPIAGLRRLWQAYQPQMNDYVTRALNPLAAPSYGVPGDE
ncbi:DUF1028 domain-containing protein [Neisseriaceae bacterium JH1-16]|nr:DUF1028 domain-containing protein [Neisseriaceae bacterium JH1-16]